MRIFATCVMVCLLGTGRVISSEASKPPAHAPASFELRDQYDAPQRLAFPATNIIVLTIADKKGSEQIDGWVAALKARYAGRIELRGLADVGGVPWFLRGKVRKKFQETRTYPVMMDWSGKVCAQFGFKPGLANVLVFARDGNIHARLAGPALEPSLKEFFATIDGVLLQSTSSQTNPTLRPTASLQP